MKVILVGGSENLLKHPIGEFIDSFDRVVRFNGGNPLGREESLGWRTDYWSFSTLFAAQYSKWAIDGAIPMMLNMRIEYPIVLPDAIRNDPDNYQQLRSTYGHPRPSTGLVTAHYIANMWECDLHCIGFDFFETNTWYTGPPSQVHNGKLEHDYMQSLGVEIIESRNL